MKSSFYTNNKYIVLNWNLRKVYSLHLPARQGDAVRQNSGW